MRLIKDKKQKNLFYQVPFYRDQYSQKSRDGNGGYSDNQWNSRNNQNDWVIKSISPHVIENQWPLWDFNKTTPPKIKPAARAGFTEIKWPR